MKTTHVIRICFVAMSFSLFVACKKDNAKNDTPATTDLQTSSDDQAMSSNENDALSNDISASLESNASYARIFADPNIHADASMRVDGDSPVCDAALSFDTTGDIKKLTITYNGSNCWGGRSRTGTVTISEAKGVHWRDAGAVVTITIQNLSITRAFDGKSLVINGVKKITNTSGGLMLLLANHGTIVHDIVDTLTISCDKGIVRTWNASKHRVFLNDNGNYKLTTTGTHSDGTHNDIAEWGANRFGVSYTDRITVPKVISSACTFRLVAGQDTFTRGDNFAAVVTYGLDANGAAVSCPQGSFYASVAWTYIPTGKTGSFLFKY
jgi:hypothetical protein